MRAIIVVFIASAGLFLVGPAFGKSIAKTEKVLAIRVQTRYGVKRTTIEAAGAKWVCKTELSPYHLSPVAPYSKEALARVRTSPKVSDKQKLDCRETVTVSETSKGTTSKYRGCATDSSFTQFIAETDRGCGRN